MKKIIAILLILTLVFVAGCGITNTEETSIVKNTDSVQDTATSAEIQTLDSELNDVQDLEEDLDMSDLDSLDEELDFEI